jgi:hypothetical protein
LNWAIIFMYMDDGEWTMEAIRNRNLRRNFFQRSFGISDLARGFPADLWF